MPQFIYGNDYGDVANRELATDSARDSRIFQSLAAQRAVDQMAQQQQQQEIANALHVASLVQNSRQTALQNRLAQQRYGNDQSMDWLRLMLSNKQFYDELGSKEKLARLKTTEGQQERDYSEAQDAVSGGLTPPESVRTLFPHLTDTQFSRLKAYWDSLASQEEQTQKAVEGTTKGVEGAVTTARRAQKVSDLTAEETKAKQGINLPQWLGGGGTESTIAQMFEAQRKAVPQLPADKLPLADPKLIQDIIKNYILRQKGMSERVYVDPDTQEVRTIPAPRRFQGFRSPIAPPASPVASPTAGPSPVPRPQGLSDAQLISAAMAAIRQGKDTNSVIQRLQAWGLTLK